MISLFRSTVAVLAVVLAGTTLSSAHELKVGDLNLSQLWSRATPAGAKVAAAYLTIENTGSAPDRLVGASAPAGKAEVHEMTTANGVMTMRPLESGLVIAPGQKVTFAPGGIHLMLTDLKEPLKEGEMLHVTLQFEKAGPVDATFHIRSVGAQGPGDAAVKPGQMDQKEGHPGMKKM
jgi:periplasmic copper chaperone A